MLNRILQSFLLTFIFACTQKSESLTKKDFSMLDYRVVKLHLDTMNAQLRVQADSNNGKYKIPYSDFAKGRKHLIFFGTSHVRDTAHPQFIQLTEAFSKLRPQIAFNEGGEVPLDRTYSSPADAITRNGEIGLLKYLCDNSGIRMKNGDMDEKNEIPALLKKVRRDQLYLYLALERFLNGYRNGYYPNMSLSEGWETEFIPYVQEAGLGLTTEQQSLDTLKSLYKRYLKKDFNIQNLADVHDYYLIDDGLLGDVGRATKIARDEVLLQKIDEALSKYDRVFVVFGGSHRIALEPALEKIMMDHSHDK